MSLAHFPQAYKIWKNKSAKDVSLISYTIFMVGTYVWFIYGLYLNQWPVIISYGVGVIGTTCVFVLILVYRGK